MLEDVQGQHDAGEEHASEGEQRQLCRRHEPNLVVPPGRLLILRTLRSGPERGTTISEVITRVDLCGRAPDPVQADPRALSAGRAPQAARTPDPRVNGIPSTKGVLWS
ncbi:hypothetical protein GCM10009839_47620 [Catenulispora yoronensis]|uniref:Uncharacterized protein n=1 Tax=Catenulispora yoronensis TaxID=450799 RepID=A0ABP5G6A4_9ACTN